MHAIINILILKHYAGPKADPPEYEVPKTSAADLLLPFTYPGLTYPYPAIYPHPASVYPLLPRYTLPYVPIYPLTYKYGTDQPVTHTARADDVEKLVVPEKAIEEGIRGSGDFQSWQRAMELFKEVSVWWSYGRWVAYF